MRLKLVRFIKIIIGAKFVIHISTIQNIGGDKSETNKATE